MEEVRQRTKPSTVTDEQSTPSREDGHPDEKLRKTQKRNWFLYIFWRLVAVLIFLYVCVPAAFFYSNWIRGHVVFLTFMNVPPFPNLTNPSGFGLNCPRLFYVESEPSLKLGAWYIPSVNEACDQSAPMFQGNDPVVLYLHGNSGSRGGNHRVSLYKLLTTEAKVHVVAFDYRGYGDSSTHTPPSVKGLVNDALAMYQYLRRSIPANRIIIYGHSLGTGVGTHLLAKLNELKDNPAALILESPFDKISNVVKRHPLGRFHRLMPLFEEIFVQSIQQDPTTNFDSWQLSKGVHPRLPVMILHARDDAVIPFDLAEELHRKFALGRRDDPEKGVLKFVEFDAHHGYGHKYIFKHPGIAKTMRDFMDTAVQTNVNLNL